MPIGCDSGPPRTATQMMFRIRPKKNALHISFVFAIRLVIFTREYNYTSGPFRGRRQATRILVGLSVYLRHRQETFALRDIAHYTPS